MSPVQRSRLAGFNASLKTRGVSIIIQPGEVSVSCLVEVVTEQTRQRLQIADERVTHIVHIGRAVLANVDRAAVSVIDRTDSEASYRVQNFTDDPQRPTVLFHCVLS